MAARIFSNCFFWMIKAINKGLVRTYGYKEWEIPSDFLLAGEQVIFDL